MEERFSQSTRALLDQASQICTKRGAKLTELRRNVLGLVLESPSPAGAYELLDQLRALRGPSAPPTVYRALEFLVEHGFIHRVERLAAFVGCIGDGLHAPDHGHDHAHAAQFLICLSCKRVAEIEDLGVTQALQEAARRVGFTLARTTIEAEGICADCLKAGKAPPASSTAAH
jgi:Fur family zinc uptake transcriptional regulator